jgi:excisionase family DNA binding protein
MSRARLRSSSRSDLLSSIAAKPLLYSQREAAALLGVSERTLRTLISKRKLIPKYIGRRCMISAAVLEKFARDGAQ